MLTPTDPPRTVGQQLEHDHHRIDEGFATFARSLSAVVIDRAAFDDAANALRHHIYVEESLHFPVMRASGLLGPVLVMLREHGEIWDLLDDIAAAIDHDDDPTVGNLWPELVAVLSQHNMKEERILYPAGDEKLSVADADLIVTTLTTGSTPPGWICEMATAGNRDRASQ